MPVGDPLAASSHVEASSSHAKRDLASWWKNFSKKGPQKRDDERHHTDTDADLEQHGIFGVPLQTSVKYANVAISLNDATGQSYIYGYVPIIVAKCGVFLKEKATDVEGIFRLSGSEKRIKELKTTFDAPDRYGKGLNWTGYTVHDAANILRRYFNQLPEPIIPLDFYTLFRAPLLQPSSLPPDASRQPAVQQQQQQHHQQEPINLANVIKTYQDLITKLPPLNRQLLLYILDLLAVFASKSELNKMTTHNLAAIFQPGILSHPDHAMAPHEYKLSQSVLIFLIENQDHFLIGMQGTAADAKTIQEVESVPSTPQPQQQQHQHRHSSNNTPKHSKSTATIVRSSSNSSRYSGVRRSASASSHRSNSNHTLRASSAITTPSNNNSPNPSLLPGSDSHTHLLLASSPLSMATNASLTGGLAGPTTAAANNSSSSSSSNFLIHRSNTLPPARSLNFPPSRLLLNSRQESATSTATQPTRLLHATDSHVASPTALAPLTTPEKKLRTHTIMQEILSPTDAYTPFLSEASLLAAKTLPKSLAPASIQSISSQVPAAISIELSSGAVGDQAMPPPPPLRPTSPPPSASTTTTPTLTAATPQPNQTGTAKIVATLFGSTKGQPQSDGKRPARLQKKRPGGSSHPSAHSSTNSLHDHPDLPASLSPRVESIAGFMWTETDLANPLPISAGGDGQTAPMSMSPAASYVSHPDPEVLNLPGDAYPVDAKSRAQLSQDPPPRQEAIIGIGSNRQAHVSKSSGLSGAVDEGGGSSSSHHGGDTLRDNDGTTAAAATTTLTGAVLVNDSEREPRRDKNPIHWIKGVVRHIEKRLVSPTRQIHDHTQNAATSSTSINTIANQLTSSDMGMPPLTPKGEILAPATHVHQATRISEESPVIVSGTTDKVDTATPLADAVLLTDNTRIPLNTEDGIEVNQESSASPKTVDLVKDEMSPRTETALEPIEESPIEVEDPMKGPIDTTRNTEPEPTSLTLVTEQPIKSEEKKGPATSLANAGM